MSKRTNKKKQKQLHQAAPSSIPPAAPVDKMVSVPATAEVFPAANGWVNFYIQYQGQEYLEKDIIEKIKEKCKAEGTEISGTENLSVYLKLEDKKAYFTCAHINGAIEL